jgi:hypothetical protein
VEWLSEFPELFEFDMFALLILNDPHINLTTKLNLFLDMAERNPQAPYHIFHLADILGTDGISILIDEIKHGTTFEGQTASENVNEFMKMKSNDKSNIVNGNLQTIKEMIQSSRKIYNW